VRAADAEVLGGGPVTIRLLVDSESTDGAISANRTLLRQGASGPPPHYHAGSAEIFFILAGSLQALAGDRVVALSEGDFLVIPRQMPHAFAAPPQADCGHPMTVTARRPVRPRVRLTNRIVTMLLRLGVPLALGMVRDQVRYAQPRWIGQDPQRRHHPLRQVPDRAGRKKTGQQPTIVQQVRTSDPARGGARCAGRGRHRRRTGRSRTTTHLAGFWRETLISGYTLIGRRLLWRPLSRSEVSSTTDHNSRDSGGISELRPHR
jgi:quercetin dioxygenase-like cupin family protein